ncbi:MAG TPA: phospholipase [Solirubrobacterales bacterium]|nr:phospholipase [Solirubrobacterales bacterium]
MSGDELPHRIREPAGEPEGALILLHGRGLDENDLYPLLDAFDPERRLLGMTPAAPLTNVPPGGRHWYVIEEVGRPHVETFVASMTTTARFVDGFLRQRGIDWAKAVIGGFSQGGAVACALGLGTGRPRAAGLLAMSCFLPMVRGWRLDVRAKAGMPAYVCHGAFDNVIPVGFGRRLRDELIEGGLDVIYREPRILHSVDPELIPEIAVWTAAVTGGAPMPAEQGPASQV